MPEHSFLLIDCQRHTVVVLAIRAVLSVLCVLLQAFALLAQPMDALQFERIGREQGLSEGGITALLQDSRGFLWVGTHNGLNRYDGYSFTVFRQEPNDSLSLASSSIRALVEDRVGNLWIATANGLHYFHRHTGKFTRYQHNPNAKNTLPSNDITALALAPQGELWIGTKRGVSVFDQRSGKFTTLRQHKKKPNSLSDNDVSVILIQKLDFSSGATSQQPMYLVWVGTRTGGLNVIDPAARVVTAFKHDPANTFSLSDNGITALALGSAQAGGANTIWVGTRGGGLNHVTYNLATRAMRSIRYGSAYTSNAYKNNAYTMADNFVRTLAISRSGNVIIGTRNGLHILTLRSDGIDEWNVYKNRPNDLRTLSENDITAIYQDRQGLLWVGTSNNGLNKFVPRTAYFSSVRFWVSSGRNADPSNGIVSALCPSIYNDSTLWVGTNGGAGNWKIDRTGVLNRISLDKAGRKLSDDLVTAILEDRTNPDIVWIGTENGLNQYSRKSRVSRVFRHELDNPSSLSDDFVNCIIQDRTGTVWVGTSGGGLNRYNRDNRSFTSFQSDPTDSTTLPDNFVFTLMEDKQGNLWVGTSNGLAKFDSNSQRFTTFKHDDNNPRSLRTNSILSLLEDSKGRIWVGTYGGGVNVFNPKTQQFFSFSERDGLPNEVIYGIMEDKRQRLWLTTGRGLARVTLEETKQAVDRIGGDASLRLWVRVYDVSDGLLGNQFRKGAFAQDAHGTMYVGVAEGFNVFHPDSLYDNPTPPPVVLTAFRKYNKLVTLDSSIGERTTLVLEYTDNTFSFEFAALDFSNPLKNQYAYRLQGWDDRWVMLGNERVARYTNLDPGEYIFQVKASNSDGVWNEEGTSLRLVIRPPWWGTLWFRALAVMTFVGLVVGSYRWRVQSIKHRNRRLEQLIAERTEEIAVKNSALEQLLQEAHAARAETEHAYNLLALEHNRKSIELEEARLLQLSMLPKEVPHLDHLDVAFSMRTATEVGGDYYDYSIAHDGTLTLAVGDATGHGVRAGMLVSIVKSNFHALADTSELAHIAGHICRNIKRMNMHKMFMCLTLLRCRIRYNSLSHQTAAHKNTYAMTDGGVLDSPSDDVVESPYYASIELSGAGMPPLLIFRSASQTVESVTLRGIVLGAVADFAYQTKRIYLRRGDVALLMSDGLVELFNGNHELLGMERITACFREYGACAADELLCALNRLADTWLSGLPQNDDIALVALKVS